MADDDLMTVAEVAGLLKLNRQTLYNWIADGTLAHTRVGRGFRIRREDYELLAGAGGSDPAEADLLTVAEVAQLLTVNQQTVRNWIDREKLPAMHVGRRVRIRRQDLDAIIEAGSSGTTQVAEPKGPTASDFWGGELVGEAVPPS